MKKWLNIALVIIIAIALLLAVHSGWHSDGYLVGKIIDGDTVHVTDSHGHDMAKRPKKLWLKR